MNTLNMSDDIEDLKMLCKQHEGELYQVLILSDKKYFVVSIDSFNDCMNDTVYYIDSRYQLGFKDIDKWLLLSVI